MSDKQEPSEPTDVTDDVIDGITPTEEISQSPIPYEEQNT